MTEAPFISFSYNNFCGVNNYNNPNAWNFGTWDNWAKNTAINRNVKVYIGAPAAPSAAGSGYVDAATLGNIAKQTRSQFSSFGGIMLWDVSQAYANGRYDVQIKNAMGAGTGTTITTPTSTHPSTTTTPTTTKTTTTVGSGSCAGVAAWISTIAYVGGNQVTYNGHLWTAKWWTQADTPGGAAGVWTDNGACSSLLRTADSWAASVSVADSPAITSVAASAKVTDTVPKAPASPSRPSSNDSSEPKEGTKNVRSSRFFKS
ncbi:hypothetical protein D9615_003772 [Tricholomella constricta]|uniref:Chitin-binding type-3 domain-containing protein n=1 Tax=Tricholomella constricta TaxID=117010 RepID=A0A8H5M7J6_9AGAR|nr:hypothetical protein D9615_003772 [Tricholomella constricta]